MSDDSLQRELKELHAEAAGGGGGESPGASAEGAGNAEGERGPDYDGGALCAGYHVVYEIANQADIFGEPWALSPQEKHSAARDLGRIADRHLPDDGAELPPWADYVFAAFTVAMIAAPRWAAYQQMKAAAEAEAKRQPRANQREGQASDGAEDTAATPDASGGEHGEA